jgi:MFS family permease
MGFLVLACLLMQFATSDKLFTAGLVILGVGLAAGFPLTLAFVGDRYQDVSGTAFSIVISISLVGSMISNYAMGLVAERFGIQHLITMAFVLTTGMFIFLIMILKKLKY